MKMHNILSKFSDDERDCLLRAIHEFPIPQPSSGNKERDFLMMQYGQKLIKSLAKSIVYPRPRMVKLDSGHVIPEMDHAYGYTVQFVMFYFERNIEAAISKVVKKTIIGDDLIYPHDKVIKFIKSLPNDIKVVKEKT